MIRTTSAENLVIARKGNAFSGDVGYYAKSMKSLGSIRVRRSIKHIDHEQNSPVSPLQFGHEDNNVSDDQMSGSSLNASSASDADSPYSSEACSHSDAHYSLPHILQNNRTLKDSLAAADGVSDGLLMLDVKISNISLKISQSVFTSLHANSNKVTNFINKALAQAAEFVKIYDAEHDVRRAVGAGPEGIDAQTYVQYVKLFENILTSKSCSRLSITLQNLQESIQALIKSSLLDRLWITRLNRIGSSLQRMSTRYQEESSSDVELLETASQHLVRLWRTILTDYGMIIPLPVALPNSEETLERLLPPPPPLSPHLVLALRDIIENLASKGKEKVCMESYKDIRSAKASESLQTLCPDYLEFCGTQAFDTLNWVDLNNYIRLWKQHLEVLTNILLTVEYELCRQVFSSSLPGPVWKQCFAKLAMQAGLQSFISFSEAVFRCKHEPPQKLFKLLDMVAALEGVKTTLKDLLTDEIMSSTEVNEKLRNAQLLLGKAVSKSFRHFRFQVDMQGPEEVPLDGGVLQLSITILTSLCELFTESYQLTLRQAISLQPNEKGGNPEDRFELSHTIHHMLTSLERRINDTVTHISSKGQTLPSLFLMNNYWYIHVALSQNEKLCSLLGNECLERYREKANLYAHKYQKEAWAAILEYLSTEQNEEMMAKFTHEEKYGSMAEGDDNNKPKRGGGGSWTMLRSQSFHGGRSNGSSKKNQKTGHGSLNGTMRSGSMRDPIASSIHHEVHLTLELQRVRAFQVAFEGVCQQHKGWKIPDKELRETLGKAVLKLVVPAYEAYLKSLLPIARHSKAQVQLKYSVAVMERMIKGLFQIVS